MSFESESEEEEDSSFEPSITFSSRIKLSRKSPAWSGSLRSHKHKAPSLVPTSKTCGSPRAPPPPHATHVGDPSNVSACLTFWSALARSQTKTNPRPAAPFSVLLPFPLPLFASYATHSVLEPVPLGAWKAHAATTRPFVSSYPSSATYAEVKLSGRPSTACCFNAFVARARIRSTKTVSPEPDPPVATRSRSSASATAPTLATNPCSLFSCALYKSPLARAHCIAFCAAVSRLCAADDFCDDETLSASSVSLRAPRSSGACALASRVPPPPFASRIPAYPNRRQSESSRTAYQSTAQPRRRAFATESLARWRTRKTNTPRRRASCQPPRRSGSSETHATCARAAASPSTACFSSLCCWVVL
mmetsp:Transcript_12059/g.44831  ORF Transcript_12059/g.44831 Transcript_12059/m.44831 type:complete len:362 (+) Transcript_12059:1084-2169(+)